VCEVEGHIAPALVSSGLVRRRVIVVSIDGLAAFGTHGQPASASRDAHAAGATEGNT
jgi:hypothetical protein